VWRGCPTHPGDRALTPSRPSNTNISRGCSYPSAIPAFPLGAAVSRACRRGYQRIPLILWYPIYDEGDPHHPLVPQHAGQSRLAPRAHWAVHCGVATAHPEKFGVWRAVAGDHVRKHTHCLLISYGPAPARVWGSSSLATRHRRTEPRRAPPPIDAPCAQCLRHGDPLQAQE
jgi:hypothetical protein